MQKTILFIPVSGPKGIGEYMRARAIAQAMQEQHPDYRIRFVVSRSAPYVDDIPYESLLLNSSAAYSSGEIVSYIDSVQPDLVIFDSAARSDQLTACKKRGIPTVFVSSRLKSRRKAFGWRRRQLLTDIWIIQPRYVDGDLTNWERLKTFTLGKMDPLLIDTIFDESNSRDLDAVEELVGDLPFHLFTSGGGGIRKNRTNATEVFYSAARGLAETTEIPGVLLLGANCPNPECYLSTANLKVRHYVNQAEYLELVRRARLVITGGGSGMAQSLAMRKLCVVAPTAKDQPHRIEATKELGLVCAAQLSTESIVQNAHRLATDPGLQDQLTSQLSATAIENGMSRLLARAHLLLTQDSAHATVDPAIADRSGRVIPEPD